MGRFIYDLTDYEKMKNGTLGTATIFGETRPLGYNNETVQIGYRLGRMLHHDKIFCIDDDTAFDTGAIAKAQDCRL